MSKTKQENNYEEIEGIKCIVKDVSKMPTVRFYQNNLREEIDKYISNNTITDKKQGYVDALEINIKSAPFVIGWLYWPEDEYEVKVIKGRAKPKVKETKKPIKKTTSKNGLK